VSNLIRLLETMGEQPVFAAERERRFVVALDESGLQDEQKSASWGSTVG